jgi:hypothetical protein
MTGGSTAAGLAPKSWKAVAVWVVAVGIFITRPAESAGLVYGAVVGTARWTGYQAFADCGEPPPLEWMDPKPCPATDPTGPGTVQSQGDADPTTPPAPDPAPVADETAGSYQVDGTDLRTAMDAGTRAVLGLHDDVDDVFDRGGLTVTVGNPTGDDQ